MPLSQSDAKKLVSRRHPEWSEHWPTWCRLADALEGGDRYRYADYTVRPDGGGDRSQGGLWSAWQNGWGGFGADPQTAEIQPFQYNSMVSRNLVPHRSEMDSEGFKLYAMRLSRTPTPTGLARTVESHLAKVFGREVRRSGPPELEDWWADTDGRGTHVRRFVEDQLGPILLTLGQVDVVVDHPPLPEGVKAGQVASRADAKEHGLDLAVPGIILPELMVWWRLDNRGRYLECLTVERAEDPDDDDKAPLWFRHWHGKGSDGYDPDGNHLPAKSYEYAYGRPPIVRVFDRRKPRCRNVGKSRYAGIAELQKASYNAMSERILADVFGSHPTLQGPSDALGPRGEIKTGAGAVLGMIALQDSAGFTSGYQPWSYLEPPTGTQNSLRDHIHDLSDAVDREGALAKPAGIAGGQATGQSGVSKVMDSVDGNAVLCRVAEVLEAAELELARLALLVLSDGAAGPDAEIAVEYPKQFDLYSTDDVSAVLESVQAAASRAGALPLVETALIKRIVGLALPGLPEDEANEINAEIDAFGLEAADAARRQPPPPEPFGRPATTTTDPFNQPTQGAVPDVTPTAPTAGR